MVTSVLLMPVRASESPGLDPVTVVTLSALPVLFNIADCVCSLPRAPWDEQRWTLKPCLLQDKFVIPCPSTVTCASKGDTLEHKSCYLKEQQKVCPELFT